MLIDEMHFEFELRLDRIASQDREDLFPAERDAYLNRAILFFAKDRYNDDNAKRFGFETNQERISNLANLHIKSPYLQPAVVPIQIADGLYELKLNSLLHRYLFLTSAKVKITKDNCSKTIDAISWQIDDVKTVYSQPSFDWGRVHLNFGKSTTVAPANNIDLGSLYLDTLDKKGIQQFDINEIYVNYVKYPNRVCLGGYKHIDDQTPAITTPVSHCDIDAGFHDEIVNLAVQFAFGDIQDPTGYQIYTQQTQQIDK